MLKTLSGLLGRNGSHNKDLGFSVLSAEQFRKAIATNPEAVVIDVRTPEEFRKGHIPGAVNINLNSPEFLKEVDKLDRKHKYYVYCRSGQRSAMACAILAQESFGTVYDLRGGTTFYEGKLEAGE